MTVYTRPDTYAVEVTQLEGPVRATALGFGGMQAVTKKGPIGVPIRVRSFPAWQRVFGGREAASRGDAAYEAKAFFDEGGFELLTLRQCNFTDVDDKTSYSGGVASRTVITAGVGATVATKLSANGPFNIPAGATFGLDVDNGGADTVTFDAVAAISAGSGLSISDLTSDTFIVTFSDGVVQTVTFAGTESTVSLAADKINSVIYGGRAIVNSGELDIEDDILGTSSQVVVGAGTANTELGQTPGTYNGSGDSANSRAVTAAEAEIVIEADTDAEVTVVGTAFRMDAPAPGGASSELDFQAGTALIPLGLSVETILGTAAGATYSTLELEAGYHGVVSPGVDGNSLKAKLTQNPIHPSVAAGSDLAADATASDTSLQLVSSTGLVAGSVIKIDDGTNTEYFEISEVRNVVSGGAVQFFVDLSGSLTNSFLAAATTIESREFDLEVYEGTVLQETHQKLSMLDTADNYVETVLNDENTGSEYFVATDLDAACGIGADLPATDSVAVALAGGTDETTGMTDTDWIGSSVGGTGLYGWDIVREFMPFCTVGNNNAAVVHAAAQYALARMFMFYVGYTTVGLTAAAAVSYRQNTLGLDSSFVALYGGGMKVFDPEGSGSSPRRLISGIGGIMGVMARVDSLPEPNGGPWQSPAGEGDYGVLRSALDVATEYNDSDTGLLNDAHVNTIRKFGNTSPVTIWGARTLDSSTQQRFRYISVRRFFQYAEKSIIDSTRWAVFRNNDFRLWGKLKDRVNAWLGTLMPLGAFPTPIRDLAFFVKSGITDGVMTSGDVDAGIVKSQIGLAPNKPGEFVIFEFTQYDSGYDVAEV